MAVSAKKKSMHRKAASSKKADTYYAETILEPAARLIAAIRRKEKATKKPATG